ncbi:AI-2E family transporter [Nostocoides sp. F2B08]|nr:AI-2E family transporter [Tetrasphaera sp. F2B08]
MTEDRRVGADRTPYDPRTRPVVAGIGMPRLGVWAWAFVGIVAATAIIVTAFAAVKEIMLPLTFAVVLAIIFKPMAVRLTRRGMRAGVAAGIVVLGLLGLMVLVAVATVQGIVAQRGAIGSSVDDAAAEAGDSLSVDPATWSAVQESVETMAPTLQFGFVSTLVSGLGALVVIASASILGALIMYYLLKDGTRLRRSFVNRVGRGVRGELDDFIGAACRTLRSYGWGRTVMSAIVATVIGLTSLLLGLPLVLTIVVVNFVGGYIPYIGAFLGGGLAVIIALGDGGIPEAVIMLIVVLAANLLLENFVEPVVMGSNLDIHPLVVLVVTALGGLVGGIVGLILAVPATVIAADGLARLQRRGVLDEVADRAEPAVRRALD